MSSENRSILIIVIVTILLHISIWLIGYFTNRISYLVSFLNFLFAASILAYWLINEIIIRQNSPESRELVFVCFIFIVAGSALYKIISASHLKWLAILQYVFFGIDVAILIAALIFMLTFKISRLF